MDCSLWGGPPYLYPQSWDSVTLESLPGRPPTSLASSFGGQEPELAPQCCPALSISSGIKGWMSKAMFLQQGRSAWDPSDLR